MNREFLMLAKTYNPNKHDIAGWYVSEKLDGMRAFWDGGVTRGIHSTKVPWANNTKSTTVATGLWSRYGNVIHAPYWWTSELPNIPLDGELYLGRGRFQETISIVRSHGGDWTNVRFVVFDTPPSDCVYATGRINNPNFRHEIVKSDCLKLVPHNPTRSFTSVCDILESFDHVEQEKLSDLESKAHERVQELLYDVSINGGEGLMLRAPYSVWEPKRTPMLLKVKKMHDAEGVVIAHNEGIGKYDGMLGSLTIQWNNVTLDIGGFNDEERFLVDGVSSEFPLGSVICFKYAGLTDAGVPREARYYRKA